MACSLCDKNSFSNTNDATDVRILPYRVSEKGAEMHEIQSDNYSSIQS